jgi:N-acetyl-gamma-glutamylphosphate reductase
MKKGNRILITSVIDNLVKGASGQAVKYEFDVWLRGLQDCI